MYLSSILNLLCKYLNGFKSLDVSWRSFEMNCLFRAHIVNTLGINRSFRAKLWGPMSFPKEKAPSH